MSVSECNSETKRYALVRGNSRRSAVIGGSSSAERRSRSLGDQRLGRELKFSWRIWAEVLRSPQRRVSWSGVDEPGWLRCSIGQCCIGTSQPARSHPRSAGGHFRRLVSQGARALQ